MIEKSIGKVKATEEQALEMIHDAERQADRIRKAAVEQGTREREEMLERVTKELGDKGQSEKEEFEREKESIVRQGLEEAKGIGSRGEKRVEEAARAVVDTVVGR